MENSVRQVKLDVAFFYLFRPSFHVVCHHGKGMWRRKTVKNVPWLAGYVHVIGMVVHLQHAKAAYDELVLQTA